MLIVGLGERYTFETNQGIPSQWQRFRPYIGNIAGQIGGTTYGVCCNSDGAGHFEYVAGVEVSGFPKLPGELSRIRIPEQRYAVFSHRGHASTMRSTVYTIWNKWLPASGYEVADTPDFERYDENFDAKSGRGTIEIWLPIRHCTQADRPSIDTLFALADLRFGAGEQASQIGVMLGERPAARAASPMPRHAHSKLPYRISGWTTGPTRQLRPALC